MRNLQFFLFVVLVSTLPASGCKTPVASGPTVVSGAPAWHFEEEKLPSANPCAVCVAFDAPEKYTNGNIVWNLCSDSEAKGYLDLKLLQRGRSFRIRLLRDCGNPGAIKILRCVADGSDDFYIGQGITVPGGNISSVSIFEKQGNTITDKALLKVTIPSSNQIGINLAPGWLLYYGKQRCTAGGN